MAIFLSSATSGSISDGQELIVLASRLPPDSADSRKVEGSWRVIFPTLMRGMRGLAPENNQAMSGTPQGPYLSGSGGEKNPTSIVLP